MDSQELKIGDVVELKSGSERMTVALVTREGEIMCTYWYGGVLVITNPYHKEVFKKIDPL